MGSEREPRAGQCQCDWLCDMGIKGPWGGAGMGNLSTLVAEKGLVLKKKMG